MFFSHARVIVIGVSSDLKSYVDTFADFSVSYLLGLIHGTS